MSRKQYRHMTDDDVTALVKLVRNCGIRLKDTESLHKNNFDLEQKTIIYDQMGRFRLTTIRPSDVEWFRGWLQNHSGILLFPFSSRSIYYKITKIVKSPHSMRKELLDEMNFLGAEGGIIATKMGCFINVDDGIRTKFFLELQKWEEENFGGKN